MGSGGTSPHRCIEDTRRFFRRNSDNSAPGWTACAGLKVVPGVKGLFGVVAAIAALGASAWWLIVVGSGGEPNFVEEPIEVPYDMYDPVLEGEDTPDGFYQLWGEIRYDRFIARLSGAPTTSTGMTTPW